MVEKNMNTYKMVYGDICQRSNHIAVFDESVEDFEQEILAALEQAE